MPIPLRKILTATNAPDGLLFSTGGKLADEIASIPGNAYAKRRDSLYGLLMQIFRGKRSCPDELKSLIIEAVRRRLRSESPQVVNHWVESVRQAIDYQSIKPEDIRPFIAEEIFAEMLLNAERASVHFIINSRTIEERGTEEQGTPGKARSLQSILIRRLNLYKSDFVESEPTTRYVFCLPNEKTAEYFWRGLFQSITTNNPAGDPLDKNKAKERLKFLSKYYLRVLKVPEYICGCPIVAFDPDHDPLSYSFCFHRGDRVSIMKWDADSFFRWNSLVYTPIKMGDIKSVSVDPPAILDIMEP